MTLVCLVVAAGTSQRFKASSPSEASYEIPSKLYEKLPGDPEGFCVLARCLERCLAYPGFTSVQPIIHVNHRAVYDRWILGCLPPTLIKGRLLDPVIGGAVRGDSVQAGILAIERLVEEGTLLPPHGVMVHDGARPWLSSKLWTRLHEALLQGHRAVIPTIPISDTLRYCPNPGSAGSVVPRDHYAEVQAPQAFAWEALQRAYRSPSVLTATDDASLCEAIGIPIVTIPGESSNRKITLWEDIGSAVETLAPRALQARVATGFDAHRFALLPSERPAETTDSFVMLGGVAVPHWSGVIAHSDGDVILHALVDGLLALAGAGDIGEHFPPSDPAWRHAASKIFVDYARKLCDQRGVVVSFVDMMVLCEKPKILPHREAIRVSVADLLGIPLSATALRGKTNERMGHLGRQEGLAAFVTVTAEIPLSLPSLSEVAIIEKN